MYRRGHEMKTVLLKAIKSERGSISVLTIGLFVVLLSTALVLTDISSVYLAKRSLSLASEAAVQSGMKNLDQASYYSGEYNLSQMLVNSFGRPEEDPGIPIDCNAGIKDVRQVLDSWQRRGGASARENVFSIELTDFECDGFQIYIVSSAIAKIPVPLPFINFSEVRINTHAGAVGERAESNNYSGFDIG